MKHLKRWLPAVGGLALIALLLRQIHPRDVVELLLGVDMRWFLVACAWYGVTNLLRAYRFGVMLELTGWLAPLRILPEMFALSFLNNVLPGRTGELSFPYFMHKRHGMSVGESASSLIAARVFDYVAVAVLYVVFTLFELENLDPRAARVVSGVGILLAVSILFLAGAPWFAEIAVRVANRVFAFIGRAESGLAQAIESVGDQAALTFRRMRNVRTYSLTFGWSIVIWLATFAWFWSLMQAIGVGRPYSLVVVGSTFASLAKAIPFVTIGGFGAHEAGWTVGYSLTGMETSVAIATGFAVNILTLLMSVVFGSLALIYMNGVAGAWRVVRQPEEQLDPNAPSSLDS
jgi:uncharacterized protein (TIRG00374 family)